MSHFSVMIIETKEVSLKERLAPFDENKEVDEYLKGKVSDDELSSFRKHYTGLDSPDYSKSKVNGEYPKRDMSAHKNLSDHDLYVKFGSDWNGCCWRFENGVFNKYSTYNPLSKWDWYEIGGRWAGMLAIKDGVEFTPPNFSWGWSKKKKAEVLKLRKSDTAKKKDIDLDSSDIETFAVIKDGEWFEKGTMGWFGVSSETNKEATNWSLEFYNRFIKDLPDDAVITIVDCHI